MPARRLMKRARGRVLGVSPLFEVLGGLAGQFRILQPVNGEQRALQGPKGAGEAGTVGALPVIVNTVTDALAPLGVKSLDMPATSVRTLLILCIGALDRILLARRITCAVAAIDAGQHVYCG